MNVDPGAAEYVAKALWQANGRPGAHTWPDAPEEQREHYRRLARNALTASAEYDRIRTGWN